LRTKSYYAYQAAIFSRVSLTVASSVSVELLVFWVAYSLPQLALPVLLAV
jgi:hypothetical protein